MSTSISEQKKNIENSIKKKSGEINRFRKEILERSKKLDDLKRKKLELEKFIEEEKKFESDKKNIIETFQKERKIDDFVAFHKDVKEKIKDFIKDDDWKKIKEIVEGKNKKILNLQKKVASIDKEHFEDSQNLEKAMKTVKEKEDDLEKAFKELKKLHLKIMGLKQGLDRYKKLIEIAGSKKEKLKMAFYIDEMGKSIQKIEGFAKSKNLIVKRLDKKGLEEARKMSLEIKDKFDKSFKKLKDQSVLLEKEKRTRELEILKEI